MRSLYATIVTSSVVIVLLSFAVGLLTANLAYSHTLNLHYEEKMQDIGRSITFFAKESPPDKLASYMEHLSGMGYQLYVFNEDGQAAAFGRAFKDASLPEGVVRRVLDGQVYKGLLENKQRWFIPNIFENKLEFSYGLPLEAQDGRHALFIRPDMVQQTEEIRLLLAVLLAVTFGFSLVLIAIKSRYIVRPVNRLAKATTELERGQYDVRLDVHRQDEIGELPAGSREWPNRSSRRTRCGSSSSPTCPMRFSPRLRQFAGWPSNCSNIRCLRKRNAIISILSRWRAIACPGSAGSC